jgi:hypothetical protein
LRQPCSIKAIKADCGACDLEDASVAELLARLREGLAFVPGGEFEKPILYLQKVADEMAV